MSEPLLDELLRRIVREEVRGAFEAERCRDQAGAPKSAGSPLISTTDAATLVGVCPATIRRWVREGQLQERRVGRRLRIDRTELLRLLAGPAGEAPEALDRIVERIVRQSEGQP